MLGLGGEFTRIVPRVDAIHLLAVATPRTGTQRPHPQPHQDFSIHRAAYVAVALVGGLPSLIA